MASPARARAGTSSPAPRVSRDDPRKEQHSPYRHHPRSPSSAMWEEFSNLMINEERVFQKQQDELDVEQQKLHKLALEQAAAEHERVRQNAERARERVELEIERERKRRDDEELRALEAERKAKAEREAAERHRLKEELERQEQEQKKRAAEEKEIHESQARLAEQKRKDEADAVQRKKSQDEADRKAKEVAAAQAAATQSAPAPAQPAAQTAQPPRPGPSGANAQTQPTAAPTAAATATQGATAQPATQARGQAAAPGSIPKSSAAQREAMHKQYLGLHQRLKTMRRTVIAQCKTMPALKGQLGEWRRLLTRTMGQLTMTQAENKAHMATVTRTLSAAKEFAQPSVDVSSFILGVATDGSPKMMSGPLVYLLNIVAKGVISQLIGEASSSSSVSDALGVMAMSVFSQPAYSYNGTVSLIDILLAKYHVVCPVLWGIYGNEKTQGGRERIGWWKENGSWLDEQLHINRMAGLATGYASLTLRDFSRSRNTNPYPPSNYWKALSYIVNTPPAELQPTHFVVLKALIDGHIPRFLSFYGQAGLVALRKALIEVPASASQGPARDGVMVMPQTIQRDLSLTL